MWGMAQEMGLEFVDLEIQSVDFAAAYHLPEATARHHNVLVIALRDGVPVVAASNPTDVFAMDDLRTIIGRNFVTVVATRSQISTYIDKAYHQGGDASEVATAAASDFEDLADEGLGNIQAVVDDAPIVRYVNLLVLQALNERASDIHVEPTGENLRIRYRIDGVLHDISTAPRAIASAVTTRLKVMADLNIAEHRLPQDGRLSLTVGNRPIDLRMATLPTIYGEKVVMRVLDKTNVVLGFEDLGFDADLHGDLQGRLQPALRDHPRHRPDRVGQDDDALCHVVRPQQPREEHHHGRGPRRAPHQGNQPGAAQRQGGPHLRRRAAVDPAIRPRHRARGRDPRPGDGADLDRGRPHRAHGARHPAHQQRRQHADAARRDGHRALPRHLGHHRRAGPTAGPPTVRPLPGALRSHRGRHRGGGMEAGRGVRATPIGPTLYRAVGCPACSNTGYRGRKALLELLVVTEDVERMIIEGGTADDIHKLAVEQGMVTLRQSGVRKALEGETTLEEVLRVVA